MIWNVITAPAGWKSVKRVAVGVCSVVQWLDVDDAGSCWFDVEGRKKECKLAIG